jgi:hydroxymethylglutaryl-CoA lyase
MKIRINDVALRDGFQIEKNIIATQTKIALIDSLSKTGLTRLEVASFVHPKFVPNMADAVEVLRNIERVAGVIYTALVPNAKGMERVIATHESGTVIEEINVFMSASETHNLANVNRTTAQSLQDFSAMAAMAKAAKIRINGTISTAFGCPFEGRVAQARVIDFIGKYLALGFDSITFGDTTGMANPVQVTALCKAAISAYPNIDYTLHFHNTRGMGLANVVAGIGAGVSSFDGSLAGLGGCPFAPGATGNICTEDMVNMLHDMGIETDVDLDKLLACAVKIPVIVGHEVPGQVMRAGKTMHLHPVPEKLYVQ